MTINKNGTDYEAVITVGIATAPDAARLREEIFITEQGFENEFDEIDKTAVQCVIYLEGQPIATGRLYDEGDKSPAHIGRVAVKKSQRGRGIGSVVIQALEAYAAQNGYKKTALAAQCRAQDFYKANGYTAYGDIFYDEFCPHVMMEKTLTESEVQK